MISSSLYASPAIRTMETLERVNISLGTPMRSGRGPRLLGTLESAVDELAHAARLDPQDVRLASYADTHPENGKPWSSKKLR